MDHARSTKPTTELLQSGQVVVPLTEKGKATLGKLAQMHQEEVRRVRDGFLAGRDGAMRAARGEKNA